MQTVVSMVQQSECDDKAPNLPFLNILTFTFKIIPFLMPFT